MANIGTPLINLKSFQGKGGRRFVLTRMAGGDILENIQEHNPEGWLEIDPDGTSALLMAKFPENKGLIAARVDYVGEQPGNPPTYFTATACRAYVNYGTWTGVLYRSDQMHGARNFHGDMAFVSDHHAKVGALEGINAENPMVFDPVHSVECNKSESVDKNDPPGFQPLEKGFFGLTLFFESTIQGTTMGVPLTMWFRPQSDDEDTGMIPNEIVEEIRKIAPRKQHTPEADKDRKRSAADIH